MTTGKVIALTRQTFVCKVMSLLFNMLSMFVIAFLPRTKCPLISWLQSPSAMILEPPKSWTLCNLPDFSVHGVLLARILERVWRKGNPLTLIMVQTGADQLADWN